MKSKKATSKEALTLAKTVYDCYIALKAEDFCDDKTGCLVCFGCETYIQLHDAFILAAKILPKKMRRE